MIKQLHYDSSRSAIIRIFGSVASVTIHFVQDSNIKPDRYICPKSINQDSFCSGCDDGVWTYQKSVISGWDCKKERWCYDFIEFDSFFNELEELYLYNGIKMSCNQTGEGADIILQKQSRSEVEVQVLTETIGEKRGPKPPFLNVSEKCPNMNEILEQFEKHSLWKRKMKH